MKSLLKLAVFLSLIFNIVSSSSGGLVFAESAQAGGQIKFNSFTGLYYLSRDRAGLSLLSSEETIIADFPADNSFTGITRSLPKKYQDHSVDVKILGVSDSAGNPIKYKTSDDKDNLILTTGDPDITLYGVQTIKIKYSTSGVVDLGQKTDQFLLNINGRGWDQPFGKVQASLHLAANFNSNLSGDPLCYTALNDTQTTDCEISTEKTNNDMVITAKTGTMEPHKALVIKLNFMPDTFRAKHASKIIPLIILGSSALLSAGLFLYTTRTKASQKLGQG